MVNTLVIAAKRFVRSALQSIALFLLIVISMIAIVRPAGASGVVTAQTTLTYFCRSGAICTAAQTMQVIATTIQG